MSDFWWSQTLLIVMVSSVFMRNPESLGPEESLIPVQRNPDSGFWILWVHLTFIIGSFRWNFSSNPFTLCFCVMFYFQLRVFKLSKAVFSPTHKPNNTQLVIFLLLNENQDFSFSPKWRNLLTVSDILWCSILLVLNRSICFLWSQSKRRVSDHTFDY